MVSKLLDLGLDIKRKQRSSCIQAQQEVIVKTEVNTTSGVYIITPSVNLEQIVFYQPEIIYEKTAPHKNIYKIQKFETKSTGPKEIQRISDIEVVSYKPLKKMKFRKKKRHSSIIDKIDEILHKGKESLPSLKQSEESIYVDMEHSNEATKEIMDLPESVIQKIFFYIPQKERNLILPRVCKCVYCI